jgi:phenylalanyl-tRNA synthetase beta chain
MKFTLSWLKEYLDTDASSAQIVEKLTALGLEVESVQDRGAQLADFVVAEILDAQPHPDADKLRVCNVRTATDERVIVCGAPNARAGLKVVLADIGVWIPAGDFRIKKTKIRGVESCGMMCSADELGLSDGSDGIIELPLDTPVGAKVVDVLGLNDVLIDIAITPNRGDCLGVYGVARDLAAAGLGRLRPLDVSAYASHKQSDVTVSIVTQDCPLFAGRSINSVRNGDSPQWLQDRLKSVGLRPISTLVDITNYFTIAFGRPLHVYDADKVQGNIVVRPSREGEELQALNGKTYTLPKNLCVIADEAGALGLGGVIGGEPSGCSADTTRVVVECAWFEPAAIVRSGRALGIDSDARYRFERSVDAGFVEAAAHMATRMIVELCGTDATQVGELVVAGHAPTLSRTITMRAADITALGGIALPEAEIQRILSAIGCKVEDVQGDGDAGAWRVTTPSWRADMEGKADIVEEVLRISGYDAIAEVPLPQAARPLVAAQPNSVDARTRTARQILASRGLLGVCHFAFIDRENAQRFQGDAKLLVEVINPISAELDTLRPSLVPALLAAVQRNVDRGFKDVALSEVGSVFGGIGMEHQHAMAVAVRSGATPQHWHDKPRPVDVFDVKADVLAVLAGYGMDTEKLRITTDVPAWYHPSKSGRIGLGKTTVAYFGMVHPAWLRQAGVEQDVALCEIFIDNVPQKRGKAEAIALKVSDFQATKRDFAFVVDEALPAADVLSAVRNAEKTLLKEVQLFDVYAGKGVPEGKKSLAISVVLQSDDKTLLEDDIVRVSQSIIVAAQKIGAQLR